MRYNPLIKFEFESHELETQRFFCFDTHVHMYGVLCDFALKEILAAKVLKKHDTHVYTCQKTRGSAQRSRALVYGR